MNPEFRLMISNSDASREKRMASAEYLLKHPSALPECFSIAADPANSDHHKAWWAIEFALEKEINLLSAHLDQFCAALVILTHPSAVRSASRIALFAVRHHVNVNSGFLSDKQFSQIVEACFGWLVSDEKVAVKSYSIHTLYEAGKFQHWIFPKLVPLLEHGFPLNSAAYKAAAKEVLKQIRKRGSDL